MDFNIKSMNSLHIYYKVELYDSENGDHLAETNLSENQFEKLQRNSDIIGEDGIVYQGINKSMNHTGTFSICICILVDTNLESLKEVGIVD